MIAETHLEWDISFLRDSPSEVTISAELQDVGEAQILAPTTGEGRDDIKGGRVVDERRTLSPIAPTPSVAPNLAATILLVAEAVGNLSFSLPTLSAAPISTTTVTSEDDSPSFPDAVVVRSDILSTIFIVEVEDDSFFIPSEIITSSSIDVCHQDKGKRVVIGDEERVVPKSSFEEEDVGVDLGGVKKIRMASIQETSGSVPTSSIVA
ncbi:hypothetical protein Adt_47561 [Abeliophyllum distichum]|uniref:Uncharacterized protein n=1 Tax=Abeliophyllum distichum TaxID=126358 RepID=A0ABD1NTP4_9LAMI